MSNSNLVVPVGNDSLVLSKDEIVSLETGVVLQGCLDNMMHLRLKNEKNVGVTYKVMGATTAEFGKSVDFIPMFIEMEYDKNFPNSTDKGDFVHVFGLLFLSENLGVPAQITYTGLAIAGKRSNGIESNMAKFVKEDYLIFGRGEKFPKIAQISLEMKGKKNYSAFSVDYLEMSDLQKEVFKNFIAIIKDNPSLFNDRKKLIPTA